MKIFILTSVYIQSYKYKTVMKKINLYEKHISKVLRLNLLVFKSSHLEKKYLKLKFSVWNMAVPLFIILGNISRNKMTNNNYVSDCCFYLYVNVFELKKFNS